MSWVSPMEDVFIVAGPFDSALAASRGQDDDDDDIKKPNSGSPYHEEWFHGPLTRKQVSFYTYKRRYNYLKIYFATHSLEKWSCLKPVLINWVFAVLLV